MDQPAPSRRTVLASAGIVAGGIAGSSLLTACGSGSSSSGSASAPAGGAAGGAAGVTALSSIPDGSTVAVENPNGGTVLLTRNGNTVTGLSAKCTHQGCTVSPQGSVLQCPCHGSEFQPGTGAVLNGPASDPLPKVAVTVANGQVTVA
ncbi:MAG TPA: Rieske (2Fe-2S) protein [Frankiaceae bacterium]|nr:Rieske (2Fe-2S) protein [Frankiaceae bacterium]